MYQSKLLQQLKILDAAELKRLLPFLKSPFYNGNPHIVKLYLLLRKEHPDFISPKLAKEQVFKKLFPKRAYDHQKLLNLMSDFTTILKRYLQVLQLEKEEETQDRLLLKAYAERPDCYPNLVKHIQKTEQKLDGQPFRNAAYYQQKFELSQLHFNHPASDKFQLSKEQYDLAMQQLDRWYILEKLLLSCEMKAREKPLSEQYNIWLLPEIRASIAKSGTKSSIQATYLAMLNLLEKREASTYFQLKAIFQENLLQFTRVQQQDVLQSLINYTIQQGNQGQVNFLKENLELYKFGLEHQLFLVSDVLNDMIYISIVNVALRSGAIEWCLEFIHNYAEYLTANVRDDAKTLATALWLYATQQPNAVTDMLLRIDFLNVYYQVQARVLLIKVYFELFQKEEGYFELVISQAEALDRFLRRNKKVSKSQKKALINFTVWVKRLARLKSGYRLDGAMKVKLRREIKEVQALYNKSWIMAQVP